MSHINQKKFLQLFDPITKSNFKTYLTGMNVTLNVKPEQKLTSGCNLAPPKYNESDGSYIYPSDILYKHCINAQ